MNIENLKSVLADQMSALAGAKEGSVRRLLGDDLEKHLGSPEVTVVTGVRRCGKSTLLKQIASKHASDFEVLYLNFEDQRLANFEVDDFRALHEFVVKSAAPGRRILHIYDEINLVDGWERWVGSLVSEEKSKVIISGSNAKLLSSELSTFLTGRHVDLHLQPFSFRETLQLYGDVPKCSDPQALLTTEQRLAYVRAFDQFMQYGGFPRAIIGKDISILGQYYQDIISKDIALRRRVRNVEALMGLGTLLASQNGRLINKIALTKELSIKNPQTLSKFCGYFLETFLYTELRLFARARRSQLRSNPKFYAVDPLLAAYSGFHAGEKSYWILENHVCNELLRRGNKVYYWRSPKGYEVDFVAVDRAGKALAIQVAYSLSEKTTRLREQRALDAIRETLGIKDHLLICADEPRETELKDMSVNVLPFWRWATSQT